MDYREGLRYTGIKGNNHKALIFESRLEESAKLSIMVIGDRIRSNSAHAENLILPRQSSTKPPNEEKSVSKATNQILRAIDSYKMPDKKISNVARVLLNLSPESTTG